MRRPWLTPVLYTLYRRGERLSEGLSRRVTEAGWFLLLMTFVMGLSGVDTQWSLHYQIFSILLIILLLALVGMLVMRRPRLSVTRRCPRFASAGEPLRFPVIVTNRSKRAYHGMRLREWMTEVLPTREEFVNRPEPRERERNLFDRTFVYYRWLWLLETKRLAAGITSEEFEIDPGATKRLMIALRPKRRGILALRSLRVMRKEPLGLFQRALRIDDDRASILILPRRYLVPTLELPGSRSLDDPGFGKTASAIGHSDDFVGLRDYRPGDPPRHIHWRSWARLNRPVVKEYEDEHFPKFALALDPMLASDQDTEVFEEAVSVAASFVSDTGMRGASLDLLFAGGGAFQCAAHGEDSNRAPEKMLEMLATVEPTTKVESLKVLEEALLGHAGTLNSVILVMTDWCSHRESLVRALRLRGVSVVTLVVTEERRDAVPGVHFLPLGDVASALVSVPLAFEPAWGGAVA